LQLVEEFPDDVEMHEQNPPNPFLTRCKEVYKKSRGIQREDNADAIN